MGSDGSCRTLTPSPGFAFGFQSTSRSVSLTVSFPVVFFAVPGESAGPEFSPAEASLFFDLNSFGMFLCCLAGTKDVGAASLPYGNEAIPLYFDWYSHMLYQG